MNTKRNCSELTHIFKSVTRSLKLFSFSLSRSKVLVLMFGPKITLQMLSTPPTNTTTTVNFLTISRHSRTLKLGIQLNQTKPNSTMKKKNLSKKSLKNFYFENLSKKYFISLKNIKFQAEHYSIQACFIYEPHTG